jgi:hypothetical protein
MGELHSNHPMGCLRPLKNFTTKITDLESTTSTPTILTQINDSKTRNKWLHMYFPQLPSQSCLADFSCAYVQDYLRQGRLYLTADYLCFHSFIGPTKLTIPIGQITKIEPKSVLMIPTAIVVHADKEYEFTSFLFRDRCIKYIETIRRRPRPESDSSNSSVFWEPKEKRPLSEESPQVQLLIDIRWIVGFGVLVLLYQCILLYRIWVLARTSY